MVKPLGFQSVLGVKIVTKYFNQVLYTQIIMVHFVKHALTKTPRPMAMAEFRSNM